MKRFLILLLFVFLLFGLYAETGYDGKQWRTKKGELSFYNKVTPDESQIWVVTEAETRPILGEDTRVYYHYFGNELENISYTIPKEKTDLLKEKLEKRSICFDEQNLITITDEYSLQLLKTLGIEETNIELGQNFLISYFVTLCEHSNNHYYTWYIFSDEGSGKFSFYYYNDDTVVYIYENFIKDKTIVVFSYHKEYEQDY